MTGTIGTMGRTDSYFATWLWDQFRGGLDQAGLEAHIHERTPDKTAASIRNRVSAWLNGKTDPDNASAVLIADYLDISPNRVLDAVEQSKRQRAEKQAAEAALSALAPRAHPYEGGTNGLTSEEIVQLRTIITALSGMTPSEVSLIRGLVRLLYRGETAANGSPMRDDAQLRRLLGED